MEIFNLLIVLHHGLSKAHIVLIFVINFFDNARVLLTNISKYNYLLLTVLIPYIYSDLIDVFQIILKHV